MRTSISFLLPAIAVALFPIAVVLLPIAVVLSAQTKDERVNEVTKVLFKKYGNPNLLGKANCQEIEEIGGIGCIECEYNWVSGNRCKKCKPGFVYIENEHICRVPAFCNLTQYCIIARKINDDPPKYSCISQEWSVPRFII